MRFEKYILVAAALAAFAGCAKDNAPFAEGKRLISEGNMDMGLERLEQAARENPDDLEIRTVLARQRDAVAARLLFEAESARLSGDFDLAEQKYRHALKLNFRNERAKAGLDFLDMDRRHRALVKQAQESMEHKGFDAAESLLRQVLQENPQHRIARQLLQKILEMEIGLEKTGPVLKTGFTKPITLEFRDASLKSVFEILARTAGINFIFDKDVKQDTKTNIFVRDAKVEDIFKLLLMTNQLTHKALNENTVLIYPNTPPKQKEYQDLMVRTFFVAYTDVKQIVAMIKGLVKTKDVHIDEKLNLFVIKDTPDAIRLVERLVAVNDVADPEVMLEVEVLEIGRNILQNLGAQFPDKVTINMTTAAAGLAGVPAAFSISSAGINATGWGNAVDQITAFITNPALLINLKRQDGIINVLANPRIRVKNREKAKVLIGDKVPVVTTTATANVGVASSVSYLDVGLKLDVESTISLQDDVSMKVNLEVSTIVKEVPIANGGLAYQVGTRNAATTLALKDGETQVLAGLISTDERVTLSKVPGLSELPWLGKLFLNTNTTRNKTEIALLITPRIVRNIPRPPKTDSELHFGTENTVGAQPVSIGKAAARSLAMSASGPGGVVAGGLAATMPQSEAQPVQAASTPASAASPVVTLAAPEQTAAGKEFGVSVSVSGAESLPAGEVEVSYDPSTLELLDGGDKSGSRTVKVSKGGGSVELRFQVIAQKPGTTQVSVRNTVFRDESGNPLPAPVALPPAASVDIR